MDLTTEGSRVGETVVKMVVKLGTPAVALLVDRRGMQWAGNWGNLKAGRLVISKA
jgi:hypothetical protein